MNQTPDKETILNRIREMASADGKPPGKLQFKKSTGIPESQWCGVYWPRWSDAVLEAGLSPNVVQDKTPKELILTRVFELASELGKFPTTSEMSMKRRQDDTFPGRTSVRKQFRNKSQLANAVLEFGKSKGWDSGTLALFQAEISPDEIAQEGPESKNSVNGFVYLMKSGKHYKIGKTNSVDRRMYEIGLQLPEGNEPVHSIETDDPSGIEAYWHNRFSEKRTNGEWFLLTREDIAVFKKRKFM